MSTFKIQDQNTSLNIVETHYYKWLLAKKFETGIHFTTTKLDYLKEQGFKQGETFLSDADYSTLSVIEKSFVRWELNTKKTLLKIDSLIGKQIQVTHPKHQGVWTYNVIGFNNENDIVLKNSFYPKGEPFTVDKLWFSDEAERTIVIIN